MRRPEKLIVAALLGLFGVLIWQAPQWLKIPVLAANSAETLPVSPAVKKDATDGRGSRKSSRRSAPSLTTIDPPELTFPPDLRLGTTTLKPAFQVPDSEKMEIGATRSQLRERYGVPTLAVQAVHDGSLVENYYYVKPDRTKLVIATLRNGKLVSAETAPLWRAQQNIAAQIDQ
jgi:hypothetical protein